MFETAGLLTPHPQPSYGYRNLPVPCSEGADFKLDIGFRKF